MVMKGPVLVLGVALSACAGGAGDPYDYKELVATPSHPVEVRKGLFDFGKDAIGWLELTGAPVGPYEIVLGEMTNAAGHVANPYPKATIRTHRLLGTMTASPHVVIVPKDRLNTTGWDPKAPPVPPPPHFPVTTAFRYVEVVAAGRPLAATDLVRQMVHYPIDMAQSSFACDNAVLNEVYDFCKYSVLATSFCGVYVDGDRERTPYEADAYVNQLCQYAIDADGSLARKSHEWLLEHPTWPTEWKQLSITMAWTDWMWTGDTRSLAKNYGRLQDRLVGNSPRRDIVDWPACERDGFVMTNSNAVVDALNCRNLVELAEIAAALGKAADAARYRAEAQAAKAKFVTDYLDRETGLFVDSVEVRHSSLHANAAALAFGLVPAERMDGVAAFLERKGMACSVYFAQFLLDALFAADRADAAIRLMSATGARSWKAMIDFGATITMEAWDMKVKPNQDLNHMWGGVPLNMIARQVLGVTPREPGFAKISVRPKVGGLKSVRGVVPTVRGPVAIAVDGERLSVTVPAPAEVLWRESVRTVGPGTHVFK